MAGLNFRHATMQIDLLDEIAKSAEWLGDATVGVMKSKSKSRKLSGSWVNEVTVGNYGVNIKVGNSHLYAWLMNYGSGSLMDRGFRNMGYDSYVSSSWFNKDRLGRDHEVLSRQEEYKMPNYKGGAGTVDRHGSRLLGRDGEPMSLERNGRTDGATDQDGEYIAPIRYKAQKPEYFFDDGLDISESLVKELHRIVDINFSSYIKGVNGK